MTEMDRALIKNALVEAIREITIGIKDAIRKKLPKEYYNLINIFNKNKVKELPPYRSYDHKIKLKPSKKPPQS